jgi:hypothetical protein
MARITKYAPDGTVTIEGFTLSEADQMMIDNGFPLEVELDILDGRKISIKQRKKIFALLNDIYNHTGQPQEDLRQMFQFYLETIKGYRPISLSTANMSVGKELIELILEWVFIHDIPLNYKTSDLMRQDQYFLYLSTVNRNCVICGKPKSDLAHMQAVGRGRNRRTIDHRDNRVLALCREHHSEQHNIGLQTFNDKYHLNDSWVKVDDKLNKMLRGETSGRD